MTPELEVLIDSREQRPLVFPPGVRTRAVTLRTGDYSAAGLERVCAIERKSPQDLAMTASWGRERFERELGRMLQLEYPAIVVEGDLGELLRNPPTRMHPSALLGSIASWSVNWGVHVFFASDPDTAAQLTLRLLEKARKYLRPMGDPDVLRDVAV